MLLLPGVVSSFKPLEMVALYAQHTCHGPGRFQDAGFQSKRVKCPSWSVKVVVSVLPGIRIWYLQEQGGGKREGGSGERIRHKISKEILKDEDH